ncbi:class I tRNA ligase family protein, partial [Candidatus Wolfebacteria bacterium]|nr:class I tRNA ligase family protein [Candidatus Wolfebacteria bacterium]
EVVKQKKIKFIPSRFEKIYYQWMKNLKDWAISRQIIWGIRIPAWFCMEEIVEKGLLPKKEIEPHQSLTYWRKWLDFSTKPIFIGINPPQKCPRCGKKDLIQDPDVLDTWFSSGQWPYLTLDYPNGKDYKTYYPTTVMETGWDILFKWVSRMIIFGVYRTGKIPFKYVYLHGLVLDKDRKKMSKSKGNVIDPLAVTELYGTDAARMALIIGNAPGNDVAISEEKIRGYRNFANKIWQATRFLLLSIPGPIKNSPSYNPKEKAMLKKLTNIKKEVTKDIETFKFHHAAEKLYHFFWHYYADKVIEEMKPTLKSKNPKERDNAKSLLLEFHATLIKLLHPFMPFITEEIYQQLPIPNKKLLMIENWQ